MRFANPEILRWARHRLNMNLAQVVHEADKLGEGYEPLTASDIQTWELGLEEPSLAQLETLAEVYEVPLGFFCLDAPIKERLPFSFDGLRPDPADLHYQSHRGLRRFWQLASWVEGLADDWGGVVHPKLCAGAREKSPNRLAHKVVLRVDWLTPPSSFEAWRAAIEGLGVYCFVLDLGPQVKVVTARDDTKQAFVGVHEGLDDADRTFALLHGYAHIAKRQARACDCDVATPVEDFANAFARAMLNRGSVVERNGAGGQNVGLQRIGRNLGRLLARNLDRTDFPWLDVAYWMGTSVDDAADTLRAAIAEGQL